MSETLPADRVIHSVAVNCDAPTAFRIWTEKIDAWWPEGHAPSGTARGKVRMQTGPGGRIFEQLEDGREQDLARIAAWSPPHEIDLDWFLLSRKAGGPRCASNTAARNISATCGPAGKTISRPHGAPCWPVSPPVYRQTLNPIIQKPGGA